MATAIDARPSWPALSEHRQLRFATIFLLYVAQGLPIGIFSFAVPAWMAANGASAGAVGFVVSAYALPWSLKLINGFLMDRWAYLPMGRRRGWLIAAQVGVVVGLLLFAARGAVPSETMILAAFAFAINLCVTFQDVAIDGMAIDLIPDEERGRANGFMFGGQALGIAIGTSMTGLIIAASGIGQAVLANAIVVAVLLSMILVLRERPGERLMPWSVGEASQHALALHSGAWKPIVLGVLRAMSRKPTILYVVAAFLAASSYGIFLGLAPLMGVRALGWSDAQVSSVSGTANLVSAGVALLFVGLLADKLGARRLALVLSAALGLMAAIMAALQGLWAVPLLFTAFVTGFLVADNAARTCMCAIAMRLCDPTVGATQFALFMAASNFGISSGAALLGTLDAAGGLAAMLWAVFAAQAAAILLLVLARVGR